MFLNESFELETSHQKTIRKLTSWLKNHHWLFQYHIVCDFQHTAVEQAKIFAMQWPMHFNDLQFKDDLRRKNHQVGILFMYRKGFVTTHISGKNFQHLYITLLSNDVLEFNALHLYLEENYQVQLKIMVRETTPSHLDALLTSIKSSSFEDMKILGARKKYSPLNKTKFI